MPRGTRTFVLILGDYKPGYTNYRLEIRDSSGRLVDQNGDLSVMLNRTLLSQGNFRLKLYGEGKPVADYVVQVE